jgi:DNA-binding MarR family transcriptional regulator
MSKINVSELVNKKACWEMARTCVDFNLRRAARKVTKAFDEAIRPSGLKITQFSLLTAAYLEENQNVGRLAELMGMDRTTLSRNLKLLEKRGLVKLEPGQDRREVRVSLTNEGLDAMEMAAPLWHEAQDEIVEGLGELRWEAMLAELRMLGKVLKK